MSTTQSSGGAFERDDPNSGAFILEQLERFASNFDEVNDATFWLYFKDELAGHQAAQHGRDAGLQAEVTPAAAKRAKQWLCPFCCPHLPDETIPDNVDSFCLNLAGEFGGTFDGGSLAAKYRVCSNSGFQTVRDTPDTL